MMSFRNILTLTLVIPLTFCQSGKVVDEKTGRAGGAKMDGPSGYYFDDMARYLGGFDIPFDSKLAPFTQGPEYAEHRNRMAVFWEKTRTHSITPVSEWRETTLYRNPNGAVCREDRPAIYPMSGADLINLYTICPHATEYVMVALEKAGDIPHPEKQTAQYYKNLRDMRAVIGNIAERNYFSSVQMRRNLVNNAEIPGIAPVLLAFASGLGWRIVDMEKFHLDDDGKPIIDQVTSEQKPRGVRIWFRVEGDKRLRSLTYIEQYLNAESAQKTHPLNKFFQERKGGLILFKAASYVMHNPAMSTVRDMFIEVSDYVVQDDSGFRYLDLTPGFEVSLYGYYRAPVPLGDAFFRKYAPQPELTALYIERNPPDLPFHFGYGSLRRPPRSNLIVAHRRPG
jgi:hypothetical protein